MRLAGWPLKPDRFTMPNCGDLSRFWMQTSSRPDRAVYVVDRFIPGIHSIINRSTAGGWHTLAIPWSRGAGMIAVIAWSFLRGGQFVFAHSDLEPLENFLGRGLKKPWLENAQPIEGVPGALQVDARSALAEQQAAWDQLPVAWPPEAKCLHHRRNCRSISITPSS